MLPGLRKPLEGVRKAESCSHRGAATRGLGAGDLTSSVTAWEQVLCSVPFVPMGSWVAPALPGSALPFQLPVEHTSLVSKGEVAPGLCRSLRGPFQCCSRLLNRLYTTVWGFGLLLE